MKTSCMHCVDPSCVSACPVSAMTKDPVTGVVGYDPDACIGCRYCVAACPFGIPQVPVRLAHRQIGKCELCRHRHKDGKYSACAEVCPTGATLYRHRGCADLHSQESRRAAWRLEARASADQRYPRGTAGRRPTRATRRRPASISARLWREGVRRHAGAQALRRPFEKLGYARPAAAMRRRRMSETIQHTLYGGLIMPFAVLGALTYVAKRNVKPDDEPTRQGGGLIMANTSTCSARAASAAAWSMPVTLICGVLIALMAGDPAGPLHLRPRRGHQPQRRLPLGHLDRRTT